MNKKFLILFLICMLAVSVSAKEVVNVSSSFNPNFVAGDTEDLVMNFKYPSDIGENNELASSLFVKVKISSEDLDYPVWKKDFEANAIFKQGYSFLEEKVNLTCFENYYFDFNYSEEAYYNISNVNNGTFYCYDHDNFLTTLKPDLDSELSVFIKPKKNIYPGNYNISVSLLELVISDLKLITENLREDCGSPRGCNGADTNGDGLVNELDIENWQEHFGSICSADEAWCNGADIDRDGFVNDSKDVLIIQKYWGNSSCSSSNEWCNNSDINKNGVVDSVDLAIFVKYKEHSSCNPFGPWCDGADVNRDGFVDGNYDAWYVENETNETENQGNGNNGNNQGGGGGSGGGSGGSNDNDFTNISDEGNCSFGYEWINGSCVFINNNESDLSGLENDTYSRNETNATVLQNIFWRNQTLLGFMNGAVTGVGDFSRENFGFVLGFLVLVSGSVGYVVWFRKRN